jgi:tripartite-type tricarboxylate transporter receptor subunit TctC
MKSTGIAGFARVVVRLLGKRGGQVEGHVVTMPLRAAASFGAAVLMIGLAVSSPALGNEYPSEPIRLVVPWPAGGGADTLARKLADRLAQRLKQPIIINNMPGATGTIGTRFAATAAPDGYTLLLASSEHAINQGYFKKLNYDGIRDFVAVGGVATQPFVVLAGAGSKIATFNELVAQSKAMPGKLTYASWGKGSLAHLGMELVKLQTGMDLLHIPYKGSAPAMTDVVAGHVDSLMISFSTAGSQYKSGLVKLLAAASPKRFAPYSEVPTLVELGHPDVTISQWYGILARAGTPRPIVDRLAAEIAATIEAPDMAEWMLPMGLMAFPVNSDQFSAFLQAEVTKWAKTMRDANIAPE